MSELLVVQLITLAFGAGGAFFLLKHTKRDVNGLGQKVRGEMARTATRHQNITVALMLVAPEDKKEAVADLLRETHEEGSE